MNAHKKNSIALARAVEGTRKLIFPICVLKTKLRAEVKPIFIISVSFNSFVSSL